MQLISPSLPIGAFTYSQGLEWAVESGAVKQADDVDNWLSGLIEDNLAYLDLPVFKRLYTAIEQQDQTVLEEWSAYLLACRETRELRQEEMNRARALMALLIDLQVADADRYADSLKMTPLAGFALAAVVWQIPMRQAALGHAWSFLENQIAAAIKLVPLGQTAGQKLLLALSARLPEAVEIGLGIEDHQIGASAPALAIASSLHETQYTRLFRS